MLNFMQLYNEKLEPKANSDRKRDSDQKQIRLRFSLHGSLARNLTTSGPSRAKADIAIYLLKATMLLPAKIQNTGLLLSFEPFAISP